MTCLSPGHILTKAAPERDWTQGSDRGREEVEIILGSGIPNQFSFSSCLLFHPTTSKKTLSVSNYKHKFGITNVQMFYVTSKYRTKPDKMPRDCRRVCSLSSEQTKYLFLIKEVTCFKFCIWAPFQIQYQTPFKFQGKQKDIHRWSNNIADHLQLLLLMNYFTFNLFLINHRETSFNPPERFDYVEFNWIRQHSSASLFLANYALLAHIKQHLHHHHHLFQPSIWIVRSRWLVLFHAGRLQITIRGEEQLTATTTITPHLLFQEVIYPEDQKHALMC